MQDGTVRSSEAYSMQTAQTSSAAPAQGAPGGPVNVLIMNLPFRVRWQDLKDLCRQACPIERADVALEIDGRSRGFGEVVCPSRADAEKLFATFDGYEWQNRRLSVIIMEGQGQSQYGSPAPSTHRHGYPPTEGMTESSGSDFRPPATTTLQPLVPTDDKLLFVGNLPFSMQWQDLKDLLRPAGRVLRTDISMSSDGRSRGWGTALFYSSEEAQQAVDMFHDTEVDGRRIKVRLDRLGGRGVPSYAPAPGARYRAGNPIVATPMQQQHPASYPLQQNHAFAGSTAGRFSMPHFQQADPAAMTDARAFSQPSLYGFEQDYNNMPDSYSKASQSRGPQAPPPQEQQQQQVPTLPPQAHQEDQQHNFHW